MTLGQWLGKWAGQWLGPVEDQPQGSMSGSATMRVTATGSIGAGGVVTANMSGSAAFSFSGSIAIQIPETLTITLGGGGGSLENLQQHFSDDDDLMDFVAVFAMFRSRL